MAIQQAQQTRERWPYLLGWFGVLSGVAATTSAVVPLL